MPVIPAPGTATHQLAHAAFTSLATPTCGSQETSLWHVAIAPGTPAAPHQVTREEIFVVLSGVARVTIDGVEADARPGDAIVVPANTTFAIANAGEGPLEALCCMPVGGQARLDDRVFTPPWAE
jgi:mannose-6-phosphate isomerase-like protein (cupin superfamily)